MKWRVFRIVLYVVALLPFSGFSRQADVPVFTFDTTSVQACANKPYQLEVIGQPGYRYQWWRLGNYSAIQGATGPTYIPDQPDTYWVEVATATSAFVSSDWKHFVIQQPYNLLIIPNTTVLCPGESATLRLSKTGYVHVDWFYNDIPVQAAPNAVSIKVRQAGRYRALAIDSYGCEHIAADYDFQFTALEPVEIITGRTSLCQGETTLLTTSYNTGLGYSYRWSTGETTSNISVTPGIYTVQVSNDFGCSSSATITIGKKPDVELARPLGFDTLCTFSAEPLRLRAAPGYASYSWNGVKGFDFLDVSTPGSYILQVQDRNGCTASVTYTVVEWCVPVAIPNTFTPNDDGINDFWAIKGLETDPGAELSIYTRYGDRIVQMKGCCLKWDGQVRGKKMPDGTYYYVLKTKYSRKKLAGAVTMVR